VKKSNDTDRPMFAEHDRERLAEVDHEIANVSNEIALDEGLLEEITYEPKRRIKENKARLGTLLANRRFLRGEVEATPSMTPAPDPGARVAIVGGAMNGDKLAKAAAAARE